ncbi:MAG: hypothetical protein JSS81_20735 [Acidobacteria bacterium]|nr:hypothetical protein [Acidobacteriota bacterium]
MKKKMRLFTVCIMFYWLLSIGCSGNHQNSIENRSDNSLTTLSTNESPQKTSRIIRKEGWKVLDTKGLDVTGKEVIVMKTEAGKSLRVNTTYFRPNHDAYYYNVEGFSENTTRLFGRIKLWGINEFKASGKIFMYDVHAGRVIGDTASNTGLNYNSLNMANHPYIILDSDGDGIFETLIDDSRDPSDVPVPRWVSQ